MKWQKTMKKAGFNIIILLLLVSISLAFNMSTGHEFGSTCQGANTVFTAGSLIEGRNLTVGDCLIQKDNDALDWRPSESVNVSIQKWESLENLFVVGSVPTITATATRSGSTGTNFWKGDSTTNSFSGTGGGSYNFQFIGGGQGSTGGGGGSSGSGGGDSTTTPDNSDTTTPDQTDDTPTQGGVSITDRIPSVEVLLLVGLGGLLIIGALGGLALLLRSD